VRVVLWGHKESELYDHAGGITQSVLHAASVMIHYSCYFGTFCVLSGWDSSSNHANAASYGITNEKGNVNGRSPHHYSIMLFQTHV